MSRRTYTKKSPEPRRYNVKTRKRPPTRKPRALVVTVPRAPSSLGLLTMQQAADELTLSKASVIRLVAVGKLRAVRPIPGGKCVRIFRADLQAFVDGLRAGA